MKTIYRRSIISLIISFAMLTVNAAPAVETKEQTLARICSGGIVNSLLEAEMAKNFCLENKVDFNTSYARLQILKKQAQMLEQQVNEYENSLSRGIYKKLSTYNISEPMMYTLFSVGAAADFLGLSMVYGKKASEYSKKGANSLLAVSVVAIGLWISGLDPVQRQIHQWADNKLNVTPENIVKVKEILSIVNADLADREANLKKLMEQ